MVNDEREVRNQAKIAIANAGRAGFGPSTEVTYRSERTFANFAEWRDEQSQRDIRRKNLIEANETAIRDAFLTRARDEDGKLRFDQIFRVNLLTKNS